MFQERLQEAMARRHNRIEREPRLSQCAPNVVLARFHSTLGASLWANARLYYQTKNLGWVRPWVILLKKIGCTVYPWNARRYSTPTPETSERGEEEREEAMSSDP